MIRQAALLVVLAASAALILFVFGIVKIHHTLFTFIIVLVAVALSAAISSHQSKMQNQEDASQ